MAERPILFALAGLPFAGKTRLGRRIAQIKRIPHVDFNEILVEQGLEGKNVSNAQCLLIDQEAERRTAVHIKNGLDVVYDITPFTKARRDRVREFANALDARLLLIYVEASKEETRRRWLRNNATHERQIVHPDVFAYVTNNFEPPYEEKYILYTQTDDPLAWIKTNIEENY